MTQLMGRAFPSSFIGFDNLVHQLDRLASQQQENTYPPYNIVRLDQDNYTIEIALAGFKQEDLTIELENGLLSVSGESQVSQSATWIHKGISSKRFKRSFTLSDHMKVVGAGLQDGILTIGLVREVPEELKPRRIEIIQGELPMLEIAKEQQLLVE